MRAPSRSPPRVAPRTFPKQLDHVALDQDQTVQRLIGVAVNMLFARYGMSEIAPS